MDQTKDALQRVITKCWEDEAFKEQLLADPAATLRAQGVQIPEGMTVNVAVDSEDVRTLVIPAAPAPGRMTDEELESAAGGSCTEQGDIMCWSVQ